MTARSFSIGEVGGVTNFSSSAVGDVIRAIIFLTFLLCDFCMPSLGVALCPDWSSWGDGEVEDWTGSMN